LDQAILVNTNLSDTHPSLKDRLAALKVPVSLPKATNENAARIWLADEYTKVINEFDQEWFEKSKSAWEERYEYVTESMANLTKLRTKSVDALSDDELFEFGKLEGEFGDREHGIKLVSQYRVKRPDDLDAAYLLGMYFMVEKSEKCLAFFEETLSVPALAYDACANAFQFLTDIGKHEEAAKWGEKAEQAKHDVYEADFERKMLLPQDKLEKIDLSDEAVQEVIEKLKGVDKVKKAWIAQKVVKHYQELPAITVAVVGKGFSLSYASLQESLPEELGPFSLWVIPKSGEFKSLAKKIIKAGERVI